MAAGHGGIGTLKPPGNPARLESSIIRAQNAPVPSPSDREILGPREVGLSGPAILQPCCPSLGLSFPIYVRETKWGLQGKDWGRQEPSPGWSRPLSPSCRARRAGHIPVLIYGVQGGPHSPLPEGRGPSRWTFHWRAHARPCLSTPSPRDTAVSPPPSSSALAGGCELTHAWFPACLPVGDQGQGLFCCQSLEGSRVHSSGVRSAS